jgi:hypothetical protein
LDRLGMPFKNGHVLEFTATFHSYRVNHSSNPKGGANLRFANFLSLL